MLYFQLLNSYLFVYFLLRNTAGGHTNFDNSHLCFIGPEYKADLSQPSIVEGVDLCHVPFNHSPAL